MPRVGAPRTIRAEAKLARMIRYRRERAGWSYEGTARRLTDVGCPMQGTTVYKIERQSPPRRISVNELYAFALIFRTTVGELAMGSPEELEDHRLAGLLWQAIDVRRRAETVMLEWLTIKRAVGGHVARCGRDGNQLGPAVEALHTTELDGVSWPVGHHQVLNDDGTIEAWDPADEDEDEASDSMPAADAGAVRGWLDETS